MRDDNIKQEPNAETPQTNLTRRSVLRKTAGGAAVPFAGTATVSELFGDELDEASIATIWEEQASDLLAELSDRSLLSGRSVAPFDLTDVDVIADQLLDEIAEIGTTAGLGVLKVPSDTTSVTHIQHTELLEPSDGITEQRSKLSVVTRPEHERRYAILKPRGEAQFPNGDYARVFDMDAGSMQQVTSMQCIIGTCNLGTNCMCGNGCCSTGCVHLDIYCTGCACTTEATGSCYGCTIDDSSYCTPYQDPCSICPSCS